MNNTPNPIERLRYHVTGAIERGEKEPIVAVTSEGNAPRKETNLRNLEAVYLDKLAHGEITETPDEKFQRENFPLSFWHNVYFKSL